VSTRNDRAFYLCIDFKEGTVTRYVHHFGTWKARRMQRAKIEPPETLKAAGHMAAELERFRATGDANG
jgi:hypothetical protein